MLATQSREVPTREARLDRRLQARGPAAFGGIAAGFLFILLAVPPALLIGWIHRQWPHSPAIAVSVVAAVLAATAITPVFIYRALRREAAALETAARVVILSVATVVVAVTLYVLGTEVFFPGDFLVWSESDFVNDILKWRIGYPLFGDQVNNDSFFYPPASQLLTYLLASIAGHSLSIPAYRLLQIGYTLVAVVIAADCIRRLVSLSRIEIGRPLAALVTVSVPVLFLVSTNGLTNAYIQNLHNDALAQLVTVSAFWLLLRYAAERSLPVLVAMALIPAIGFVVKQSLVIWLPLYSLFLVGFDRPRSVSRAVVFSLVSAAIVASAVGAGYLWWGEWFGYWLFDSLSAHEISPLRSIQHGLDAWIYFALGLVGGLVLIRKEHGRKLTGLWLVWLLLLGAETYTSGAGWMMNHLGPGSLVAAIWFMAAVAAYWAKGPLWPSQRPTAFDYFRSALVVGLGVLLLVGMRTVRVPIAAVPADAYRYMDEIEREFAGEDTRRVLLDVGTWIYLPAGVVMRDRAPAIGERGYSGSGDFSGMLERIRTRHYTKILVREPQAVDSWYEHDAWRSPSGIRAALYENYREVRQIRAVSSELGRPTGRYTFRTISVLVPRSE